MSRTKRLRKAKEKSEAKIELISLLSRAEEVFSKDKKKANHYVRKARELGKKYNIRFSRENKRKICKHCYSFLKPGVNCRIRTKNKKVVYCCLECGKFMRFVTR